MKNFTFILFFLITNLTVLGQTNPNPNPTPNTTTTTSYQRPEAKERFKKYLDGTFGLSSLINPTVSATIGQIRNRPEEWERTSKGFGKRFADGYARQFISRSITYGLDEALKLDSNYYPNTKPGFKAKLSNAVLSSVTSRNKNGKRVVGIPKIVGTYSSAIIANETWRPNRFDYKDGLRDGSISFGTRILFNLVRELF